MINKKVKILESMIKRIIKEENGHRAQAIAAFKPYISLLSEFKPEKMIDVSGSGRDSFLVQLNVPGQFENPALLIEFETLNYHRKPYEYETDLPTNTVCINVWFKGRTNTPKYKQGILKLMQILASKNPKMPVLLHEDDLEGTVKQWANMKKIESMY